MKKLILPLFIIGFLLQSSCATTDTKKEKTVPQRATLDHQIDNISNQIVNNLKLEKKSTIAVIEFSNLDGQVSGFGKFLSEELITRLFNSKKFNVIERQLLEKVINEHKLSVSGLIDENTAKDFGQILGVDAIVTGSITDLGESVKVNARLIATETGRIFAVASGEIMKDRKVSSLMNRGGTGAVSVAKSPIKESPKKEGTNIIADKGSKVKTAWMYRNELDSYLAQLKKKENGKNFWDRGHWVDTVEGRLKNGRIQYRISYSAVPPNDGYWWYWWFNQDKRTYNKRFKEMADKGLTLVYKQSFKRQDGTERFQTVWHKLNGSSSVVQYVEDEEEKPAIAGSYIVDGTNPNKSKYGGRATIWPEGDSYKMKWQIGSKSYEGKGQLSGKVFTVNWGEPYPVIYKVTRNGTLKGTWANGAAREKLTPVE